MNPVRASLRYPQVTIAMVLMLVATGVYALLRMPRREDPKIRVRMGVVAAFYPGASAAEVENQVTHKVEQRLFKVEGVRREKTYSTSLNGSMFINVYATGVKLRPDLRVAAEFMTPNSHIPATRFSDLRLALFNGGMLYEQQPLGPRLLVSHRTKFPQFPHRIGRSLFRTRQYCCIQQVHQIRDIAKPVKRGARRQHAIQHCIWLLRFLNDNLHWHARHVFLNSRQLANHSARVCNIRHHYARQQR
jgi:hypothetical protein